jgi:uncharacterized membrane protein YgdD (TMEM256/DUF423 family)
MSDRTWIILGTLFAGTAVALGAIGAHALKGKIDPEQMPNFETAVRYQMYHSLALILVGIVAVRGTTTCLTVSGCLFLAGILLFSGGLYGWIFTAIKPFVHVVPIGGTLWIIAWVTFAVSQLMARK